MPTWAPRSIASATLLVVLFAPTAASAQVWASKMFDKLDHDFGVVARGSDTVFKFEVKNIYKEDIELGSVRSSCGCTAASIENPVIKTYGSGFIVAKFNTRTFTGIHSATLTVQIIKPYPAQVQVRVHGNIRGDVVFEPGSIDFTTVEQGSEHTRMLNVSHAGRSSWMVTDVRSGSDFLAAELVERQRYAGRVSYDLVVRLKDNAPPGFLKEQLVLVTNDGSNPLIPIDVTGKVTAELTVAPENLVLGDVPRGETITKRLLVRGKKPFRVTSVECDGDCFSFKTKDQAAERHIVTVTFVADREPGRLRKPIIITTDLGQTYQAVCQAYATVTEAEPETPTDSSSEEPATETRANRTNTALAP